MKAESIKMRGSSVPHYKHADKSVAILLIVNNPPFLFIHVEKDDKIAKYWLTPLRLQSSGGFNRLELMQTRKIVEENNQEFVEAWHEYFGH